MNRTSILDAHRRRPRSRRARAGLALAALVASAIGVVPGAPAAVAANEVVDVGTAAELIDALEAIDDQTATSRVINLTADIVLTKVYNTFFNGASGLPPIRDDSGAITIEGNGFSVTRDPTAPPFRIFTVVENGGPPVVILNDLTVASGDSGYGGGLWAWDGEVTINRSVFTGNRAGDAGGAILVLGRLTMIDSTVSGNVADSAAVDVSGYLTMTSSTISDNEGGWVGGLFASGEATSSASILSGNSGGNCRFFTDGSMTSGGYNISSDDTCGFDGVGDLNDTDPMIAPLADNGGETLTHALLAGSPALDAIPVSACQTDVDQRGVERPQNGRCDMGAFESTDRPICTIEGDEGDNILIGTPGDDVICGFGGRDELRGRGGNDILLGGDDDDRIFSGPGDDVAQGGRGDDRIFGGAGEDVLFGDEDDDLLFGGDDDDMLDGSVGDDRLAGGAGADDLDGAHGRDRLLGDGGDDVLRGGDSHDFLFGGNGNDDLDGGPGNDYLDGAGGPGDVLNGGDGADSIRDEHGGVFDVRGGGGDDMIAITIPESWPVQDIWMSAGNGNDVLELNLEKSVLVRLHGDDFNDFVSGSPGTRDELRLLGVPPAPGSWATGFEFGDVIAE